jgi:alanine-alpha-ketoisovalerate/valine-pyruvate aminotransferase
MIFEITDQFHREIALNEERLKHILTHPEIKRGELKKIKETVLIPDFIKQSKQDANVWVYYKLYDKTPVGKKFVAVIAKILNHHGFIITSYFTDKVKEGKTIWQR